MAETLAELGSDRAWLVHGADGTDEVSIAGATYVAELKDGAVTEREVHPEDAGLPVHPFEAILGGTPAENGRAFRALLAGEPGAYRDAVLLNAAAALVVAERAADLREGVAMRRRKHRLRRRAPPRRERSPRVTAAATAPPMSILDEIRAYKLADVAARKAARPLADDRGRRPRRRPSARLRRRAAAGLERAATA